MKKKIVKPVVPVEDTVFFEAGWTVGVGVFVRMGNNPMMPDQQIIRPIAMINPQNPTKLQLADQNMAGEISVGGNYVTKCSAAYVYGWIAMQKNLIEFRKGKKKA